MQACINSQVYQHIQVLTSYTDLNMTCCVSSPPPCSIPSPVGLSRWGRWKDILNHGRFKKQLAERDVESICRALLAYCLVHYRGDDKIKSFMWDLIAPTEDGQTKELQNHLGESHGGPVSRMQGLYV